MAIIDANTHIPQDDEFYFLDCNILMYMHYTNGRYGAALVYDYSKLITKIIGTHAKLLMTDVLLSEFINTYIQTEFHRLATLNGWPHSKTYFKQTFKNTSDYADILTEIKYIITRQMMPVFEFVNSNFAAFTQDISSVFDNPSTFDFNDRYYGYEMKNYHGYIVSNDADFFDVGNCDIITLNSSLLQTASATV